MILILNTQPKIHDRDILHNLLKEAQERNENKHSDFFPVNLVDQHNPDKNPTRLASNIMDAGIVAAGRPTTLLQSKTITARYIGMNLTRVTSWPTGSELNNLTGRNEHQAFAGYSITTTDLRERVKNIMRLSSQLKKQQDAKNIPQLHGYDKKRSKMPKSVRFNKELERVCFFDKADRPSMIGNSSSQGTWVSLSNNTASKDALPRRQWNISLPNFPHHNPTREQMPVEVSKIYFSDRRAILVVFIVVANMAYEKNVVCRFTRDYWKTISETPAQYYRAASDRGGMKYDKFVVSIDFSKDDDLGCNPFFFCVRYNVSNEQYWDNNSGMNFERYPNHCAEWSPVTSLCLTTGM
ncbi:phosphatase 1 regulatory subunit 3b [Fusarium longipes]|uniref:Phosphatase 1 regulatory subunit 3b n=1 Tax=Fusarium longipes TaxID=694270 RepID=A0A395T321_9HYPO|nr:phosphatase 1 regulatory subunit 3b [Fusarium longipes]